jgi:hypothetical protein
MERYERELRDELEKTNKARIDAEKRDCESRLNNFRENVKIKYEEQLR